MSNHTFRAAFRPLRVAWCIRDGREDDLHRAIQLTTCLWGGRYNPIIPVGHALARRWVDFFRADLLFPVADDPAVNAFLEIFPHLEWPIFPREIFLTDGQTHHPTLLFPRATAMASLRSRLLDLIRLNPGLTDRELTDHLLGPGSAQQSVNQVARALSAAGLAARRPRPDGKIGNYPAVKDPDSFPCPTATADLAGHAINTARNLTHQAIAAEVPVGVGAGGFLSEDDVKRTLQAWLQSAGWNVTVALGRGHGVDIDALGPDGKRWVIEVKGQGSLNPMRVNYFLGVLGELLQRMSDPNAKYSIALPDLPQFRRLWARLPTLAKERTGISALFVASSGRVEEVTVET